MLLIRNYDPFYFKSSQNLWDAASEMDNDGNQKPARKVIRAEDVTTLFVLGSKSGVSCNKV